MKKSGIAPGAQQNLERKIPDDWRMEWFISFLNSPNSPNFRLFLILGEDLGELGEDLGEKGSILGE